MVFATHKDKPLQIHLCVDDGPAAVDYYERAFGAVKTFHQLAQDGKRFLHCTLRVFGTEIMLHDEFPEHSSDMRAPKNSGFVGLTLNVNFLNPEDVDKQLAQAAKAGGQITMPADNQFWGARYGQLRDPFGHLWAFNSNLPEATS
jgi:PhnB protein